MGATEDIVEEYLTLVTIQARMHEAIIADADTNVSDEEAEHERLQLCGNFQDEL